MNRAQVVRDVQPMPVRTKYSHHGSTVTAILRTWGSRAAVDACRLCPAGRCCVDRHLQCLVVVGRHVPAEECPLYREETSALAGAGPPLRLHVLPV